MNIADFSTELYCKMDDARPDFPRHPQAVLSRSEVVAIGAFYAMKNVRRRAFCHRLKDNYGHLFSSPNFPTALACCAVWKPSPAGPVASWASPPF